MKFMKRIRSEPSWEEAVTTIGSVAACLSVIALFIVALVWLATR